MLYKQCAKHTASSHLRPGVILSTKRSIYILHTMRASPSRMRSSVEAGRQDAGLPEEVRALTPSFLAAQVDRDCASDACIVVLGVH